MTAKDIQNLDYDVLIVGAGFGGIYLLHHLRLLGYRCKIYEAASELGGVWHWNCYPGARVDSSSEIYQLSMPEAWKEWNWSQRYPDREEILQYFQHLDHVLRIKQDVRFCKKVIGAQYNRQRARWEIRTDDGRLTLARFFLPCVGFAAKKYLPDIPGLNTFQGAICHSSAWPKDGIDIRGKRVAVIGTGCTGVQIVQEWAKQAENLTVFQRTPNIALPMQQNARSKRDQADIQSALPELFQLRESTFTGYLQDVKPQKALDASSEEREAFFESLWQMGSFAFMAGNYMDLLSDEKANRAAYDFWACKTRARIHDPKTKDVLVPIDPVHPIGAKRPSLEDDYFEQFNRPNVEIVNLRDVEIAAIETEGIATSDGVFHQLDVIALATGFDSVTGGMTSMGICDSEGEPLAKQWGEGIHTYLGMSSHGYPNMFWVYGAHGPTGFSNGPSSIEIQGRWIIDAIQKIEGQGLLYVEPTIDAEMRWKSHITQLINTTFLSRADSWYMGANIPGKKRESMNYPAGLVTYRDICQQALQDWEGFIAV
ncbi:flavin-containing monooxygenase [Aspergillus melleus]|uniref:flavin-containing monooxygenase n=1 Tax=Aspergillus melleus TaxID=138277 RepID=UPI001E8EDE66|nr:uncharacterized protein LDX57_006962 [Aspergillus melleus]KAH8429295.1 hypothetical protein LDX57_006962 [Aspergillus melleus]